MFLRRHWIPPGALIVAQLSHGMSWLLLSWIALHAQIYDLPGIAWIHLVALGWATMAALAILLHVIPAFTDARWRGEGIARGALIAYAVGVAWFVLSLLYFPRGIFAGAALTGAALTVYLFNAYRTLALLKDASRVERAIARGLVITLTFLLLTVFAGVALAAMLSGLTSAPALVHLPFAHATFGLFGWLSLLVIGVSARTIRPITGNTSRFRLAHILVGSLLITGVPILAAGLYWATWLTWTGAAFVGLGLVIYSADLIDVLCRASVHHRPPQAFIAAAIVWLAVSMALSGGLVLGQQWQAAWIFLMLAGWIGQMSNAHIYHIGVRLLLTMYRGDEDETRPEEVLDGRLAWLSFGGFQAAICFALVGLLASAQMLVAAAGVLGFISWIIMAATLNLARLRAKTYLGRSAARDPV